MTGPAPKPSEVRPGPDLGPLSLTQEGENWRFTLSAPSEVMLELPPDYERYLVKRLEPLLGGGAKPAIEMDLQGLPAISSRQLGLMLALQKALADHCERIRITGLSPKVRHLLELTRTAQFFDLD
jgi:ABC-type transporter Mla MlaB component